MSIEERIIDKFVNGKDREYILSKRDRVVIKTENGIKEIKYYLWSSPIFCMTETDRKITIDFCFCSWSSQTTKNRIDCLLLHFTKRFYVFQKNWLLYLYDTDTKEVFKIDTSMRYTVEGGKITDRHGNSLIAIEGFKR